MPFQPGNKLGQARKDKPFRDALMMEIKEAGEDHKVLRQVARALLSNAKDGKMDAINALADRTDGKVPQGIIGGEDGDNPVGLIVNVLRFTDAGNRPTEQLAAPPVPAKPVEIS